MSEQDQQTLGQIIARGLEGVLSKEGMNRVGHMLDELFETVVDEALTQHKEMILNDLLEAFDAQIGREQQERSDVLKNTGGKKDCAWWAHNGRVDGVDTGRALVERYFVSKESANE